MMLTRSASIEICDQDALSRTGSSVPHVVVLNRLFDDVRAVETWDRRWHAQTGHNGSRTPWVLLVLEEYSPEVVSALLARGVKGMLLANETDATDLLHAIDVVSGGQLYLGAGILSDYLPWIRARSLDTADPELRARVARLTERELAVLTTLARGIPVEEAADVLRISATTVRTHVYRIRHKINARDRAELISIAFRSGAVNDLPAT